MNRDPTRPDTVLHAKPPGIPCSTKMEADRPLPGNADKKRVTMSDIAREARVSVATVSKVLNGNDRVSVDTRSRVQALLSSCNYQPRLQRRSRDAPMVDLVLRDINNPWATALVTGAVEEAHNAHVGLAVNVNQDRDGDDSWLETISARGTRGVVFGLAGLSITERTILCSWGLPFAVIDPRGEPDPTVPTVGATNWAGAYTATRHLLELGHSRVGMISGPSNLFCSRARMDGYRSAIETAGLPLDYDLVRLGDFHPELAFTHASAMLQMQDRPTAIFAGSDLQALGVLQAARLLNLHVPSQLSVVGFDDIPLAPWLSPPLTSVHQPLAEMAATAVRLVLYPPEPPTINKRSVELLTSLIIRESTAPPPRTPTTLS